jgi:hypothetical protein
MLMNQGWMIEISMIMLGMNEVSASMHLQTAMTPKITIQELALALTAKNHSPTLLNSDFLKYSGIVPPDWELARPPIFSPQISQVAFTNGINIVAQSNAITFIESLSTKPLEDTKIPAVIRKYVEALPRTDYQTLSINPRSFVTFEGEMKMQPRSTLPPLYSRKALGLMLGKLR